MHFEKSGNNPVVTVIVWLTVHAISENALITPALVLPQLSVGEMTLRLYTALDYSQNSARALRRAPNGT